MFYECGGSNAPISDGRSQDLYSYFGGTILFGRTLPKSDVSY
jgi:hypothetical protein